MRTHPPRLTSLVGVVAAAGILIVSLSGCTIADQISQLVGGREDVFSLGVGDCFDDSLTSEVEEITSVAMPKCTEPHDNEAYFLYNLTDAEFPQYDQGLITTNAEAGCLPEFEKFAGIAIDETSLYFGYYYPGEASWAQGDREILCMAYDTNGPLSEPLKGKGKGANYPL